MHKNLSYSAERFLEIFEKAGRTSFFELQDDGKMEVTVHTGCILESLGISIEFPHESVLITTRAALCVEEQCFDQMRVLLESINENISMGLFFIDENNIISFSVRCELELIERLDNPFDILFLGTELFEHYAKSILKVLTGESVFYLRP